MAAQDEMDATLFAAVHSRCNEMNEHASVSYWLRSLGVDSTYHLKQVDQSFRSLADALGYRVEEKTEGGES